MHDTAAFLLLDTVFRTSQWLHPYSNASTWRPSVAPPNDDLETPPEPVSIPSDTDGPADGFSSRSCLSRFEV